MLIVSIVLAVASFMFLSFIISSWDPRLSSKYNPIEPMQQMLDQMKEERESNGSPSRRT